MMQTGQASVDVVISYSRTDSDLVDRLESDLKAHNLTTWVDRRQLEGGQVWEADIRSAIDHCRLPLVVISPDALASPWVSREYRYALKRHKEVIPVLYHPTAKLPPELQRLQWIDFLLTMNFEPTYPVHLPPETTWHLMTNLPGTIEQSVGKTFGLRRWIEYGCKHAKDEMGWADYRLTDAASIERWWELVMCAYLLVSLQASALATSPPDEPTSARLLPLSIPPGRRTPVGNICSPISACCCTPSRAPASCCPGSGSIPSHSSPPASPISALL